MAGSPASDSLVQIIAEGRGVSDRATWQALKSEAERWKADDYDAHQQTLRLYYEGHIGPHLRVMADRRYPHTGPRMPLLPYNWAQLYALNGASVYDLPPTRYLTRDGDRLDPDEADEIEDEADEGAEAPDAAEQQPGDPPMSPEDVARVEAFEEMLRESNIASEMPEAERRVKLTRTGFIEVYSDSLYAVASGKPKEPPTRLRFFYPCDVLVLPHPRCPTSLLTALAVMQRVSNEDGVRGGSTTWKVWTRSYEEDATGQVTSFDPWRAELVTESQVTARDYLGRETSETRVEIEPILWRTADGGVSETYPLPTLPIVEWHDGIADGSPFLDADRNLVPLFDAINTSMMGEQFAVDFNGATPMIRKSDDTQNARIALGPGMLTRIPRDDDVQPVPVSADFVGIRAAQQALKDDLALTTRQSPSSWNPETTTTPTSGVALKIKNEAQTKARLESVTRAVELERRLLAVMVEVHDYWRGTEIAGDGIGYEMCPHDPPEYEDREVTQRRAIDARDAGLIDDVTAAVAAGWYRTKEEARATLAKIAREKAANPMRAALEQAAGLTKQDRLLAQANGIAPAVPPQPAQPQMPVAPTSAKATPAGAPAPQQPAKPSAASATTKQAAVDGTIQDTALNGAQVTSLVDVVTKIADGTLPRETAKAIILAAFPAMTPEQVAQIVNPVKPGSAAPSTVVDR